jgi:hypothetical protein
MRSNSCWASPKEALRAFAEDGFDGGRALMQGIAKADDERFSLYKLDETASEIFSVVDPEADCGLLLHAYVDAMTSAWTVIAFRKPDDPVSRHDSDEG